MHEFKSYSHQTESTESATGLPVPPPVPPPAHLPPSAPPDKVPTPSMTVDGGQSCVQEWRRHAKRQAEVPLEDLDPAMILSDETPGGLARAVGTLEVIEEVEPSDPEEDDESDYVAGGDFEREEGRHRGRLEELKKMQEFELCNVCRGRKLWRKACSQVPLGGQRNDLRSGAVATWSKTFKPCSLGDAISSLRAVCQSRIVDAVAESHGWAPWVADATNAFFHAAEDEDICGECPPDLKDQLAAEGKGMDVGMLPKGSAIFVNGVMCQKNLIRCEALPCFFWHENLHILVELHQDDFHCTAPTESLMWLKEELKDEIRLKFSETVYPGMRYSHLKASRLVTSQGTLIVASSRYITDFLETMGMQKCSGAPMPITSVRSGDPEADGQLLEAEDHRTFRFLRTLRPDIGFAVKELSHRLAALRVRDFERCKRLCRYLSKTRRLGVFFPRRREEDPDGFSLVAYSDSDWAGDRENRKSTSNGMIWWGPYLISDLVKGQSVVATSSGEAELYAAVAVMKDMILIKRALSFIGMSAKMELRLDSSAARAMLERQGAGRVRHVEVAVLWAQQWVKDRCVAVRATIVLTWVPRSILWHASESSLT